jgi:hypothetical protein
VNLPPDTYAAPCTAFAGEALSSLRYSGSLLAHLLSECLLAELFRFLGRDAGVWLGLHVLGVRSGYGTRNVVTVASRFWRPTARARMAKQEAKVAAYLEALVTSWMQ